MRHNSIIPQQVTKTCKNRGAIPQKAAELYQERGGEYEDNCYVISFSKYNDKMCEIANLSSNKARKTIDILKTIGMKIHSVADFKINNIDRLPVHRNGEYKMLYNGLSKDIELKEIKLQQKARMFYFDIEDQRTFYVVAIRENHLETDKTIR